MFFKFNLLDKFPIPSSDFVHDKDLNIFHEQRKNVHILVLVNVNITRENILQ